MRRNKFGKFICFVLAALLAVCFAGCSDNDAGKSNVRSADSVLTEKDGLQAVKKTGTGLRFVSSDIALDAFLNDYYSRHVRDNSDKSIGNVQLGLGRMYQKAGEAASIAFYNSTSEGVNGYDPSYNLASELDAYYVTQYGNVMDTPYIADLGYSEADQAGGLGWPFVSGWRTGNYSDEFTADSTDWTVNGAANAGTLKGGCWTYSFVGEKDEKLSYQVTDITAPLTYAPLIEIAFGLKNNAANSGLQTDIDDVCVSWQIDGQWYTMSYYRDAMYNRDISGYGTVRAWFPAYLHPSWDKTKNVTGLKMEIVPKQGKALNVTVDFNYFRLQTDTRLTTNNAWYIRAMEEYISFTGDFDMLERHLSDIRKAMLFQLYALGGKDGLVRNDYIWGKSTTFTEKGKFGLQGNGWYDCIPTGNLNTETNIEFYKSLIAMAMVEELAAAKGMESGASIRNPHPFAENAQDITWTYTPASLRALAETVKTNMRKDVADGGLWNPATGRFAWAVYDENYTDDTGILYEGGLEGEAMDYGHVQINLDAVLTGIASDEQQKSIMDWLDGKRTVEGDASTGEDIYFYEFAPRVNTRDRKTGKDEITVVTPWKFGTDVQNGGASMHISYYDLLARNAYGGADASYKRLDSIRAWYEKVSAAGGSGYDFYRAYYVQRQVEDNGDAYTMAGGGTLGAIGLDYEFYEASMLYAAVPAMYFGLDGTAYNTLSVAPNLPSSLSFMAMENLRFYGTVYDLFVSENKVIISGIAEPKDGLTVSVTLKTDGKSVYVNGEKVDGTETNGKTTVTAALRNCVIEVK